MTQRMSLKEMRDRAVYRQRGLCCYCNEKFTDENPPTAEHVVPRSKGGRNRLTNIKAACQRCNQGRGNAKDTPGLRRFLRERPDLVMAEVGEDEDEDE